MQIAYTFRVYLLGRAHWDFGEFEERQGKITGLAHVLRICFTICIEICFELIQVFNRFSSSRMLLLWVLFSLKRLRADLEFENRERVSI